MSNSPFDYINNAKNGRISKNGYVYFTVTNMMSSSVKLLGLCQIMNGLAFSRLDDETKAQVTGEILHKYNNVYLSYPKAAKKQKDNFNNELLTICSYYKCSIYEAKLYCESGYITDKDIKKMKDLLK